MRNMNAPSIDDLNSQYNVELPNGLESLWQPLYDSAVYPHAGTTTALTFFQQPIGQGTGVGGGAKTIEDTNMTLAGQLPSPQFQLVTSVELIFIPGEDPSTGPTTPALANTNFANDVWRFLKRGHLNLTVNQKPQIDISPLMKVPPTVRLAGFAGGTDTTSAAATQANLVQYAAGCGVVYDVDPKAIQSSRNFSVSLSWSSAAALASANDARVFCFLNGFMYRAIQ